MNDDELKQLWQQQPLREPSHSTADLISAMRSKVSLFRRCLNARDLRELMACAFVIVIFGVFYFTVYREPMSRVGVLIVIGSSFFIALKIVYTRLTTPSPPPGTTIVDALRAELNSVRTQIRLLRSVLWWYILPLFIGITVATWGLRIDLFSKIFCTMIFVAVDVMIYYLNQVAVAKQLLPLETQLLSLLHTAETGEPLDAIQASNLRPIIVSMASADRVKPVEFKVAFWQLAVFGIPGVIGIWFFMMLGFTMENQGWIVRLSGKAAVPADESNQYSSVAKTIVDLLNAGNDSAVQKRFAPVMSKALPPEKATKFFTDLTTRFGHIDKFDGPTANGYHGWIAFQLHCRRGELTMSLALDSEDRVTGIYFAPEPGFAEKSKSFIADFFRWQHMVWLALFFLASLLYTWLIQRTTERAVGISNLGIHLLKGQNLILWNEINNVRPMKFLHITNLWLISESGEKTIMHWTPLERHSDLKAAVEYHAPANHPIREYLSLLK